MIAPCIRTGSVAENTGKGLRPRRRPGLSLIYMPPLLLIGFFIMVWCMP